MGERMLARVTLDRPISPLSDWALSPDVVHVNHGSFGGCPRAVFDTATAIRVRLEAAPMRYLVLEWQDAIDRAREALASFLGAPADRLAFVPNATTGVATALASLPPLNEGDEILVTDHGYRAVRNQLERFADAHGARIITAILPLRYETDAAVAAIMAAVTVRTRLAVLDHITSPTGLILPLARIAPPLRDRGVSVIIDGAHAPGQLDLDVGALLDAGVHWYAGNNHKWLCAPKGTGFVVAHPLAPARAVVTSHGASTEYGGANRYHAELDWMGTHDPTPHLCVPTAIETVATLGGGWPRVVAHNHALALEMASRLGAALGCEPLAPADALGTMVALPITLPASMAPLALEKQLLAEGWELPIVDFRYGPLVRISAHLYNDATQADAVARMLLDRGVRGRAL